MSNRKSCSWFFFCDTSLLQLNCFCFVYRNNFWASCSKVTIASVITTLASRLPLQNYPSHLVSKCNLTAPAAFVTFSKFTPFSQHNCSSIERVRKAQVETFYLSCMFFFTTSSCSGFSQHELKSNHTEGTSATRSKQISGILSLW